MRVTQLRRVIVLGCVCLAIWQFGQGTYIHAKALLAQHLIKSSWDQMLAGKTEVKPWPWADTWPVARLQMPQYQADLIVLAGDSGRTLAFGPGHRYGTPLPGEAGNSVISAHRDTHFRFLKDVDIGDVITLQPMHGRHRQYRIITIQVVDARQAMLPERQDASLLTLVTCYPFDAVIPGGPLRYIVLAEEITTQET